MTYTTIQIIAVIIFTACNAGAVYLMFAEKKEDDANKLSTTGLICFLSLLLVAMSMQINDLRKEIEDQDTVIAYYEHQYKTNKQDSNEVKE